MTTAQVYTNASNYENMKNYLKFPPGILIPHAIESDPTKKWKESTIMPFNLGGSANNKIALDQVKASLALAERNKVKSNNVHLQRYHGYLPAAEFKDLESQKIENVIAWKAKPRCDFAESYFTPFQGNHQPPDFEFLIDNETLRVIHKPTEQEQKLMLAHAESVSRANVVANSVATSGPVKHQFRLG